MKFRPLHVRVVVKRIDAEDKSAGGIVVPDTAKEKPSQGEIIAVGPGGRDENGKLIAFSPRSKVDGLLVFPVVGRWASSSPNDGRCSASWHQKARQSAKIRQLGQALEADGYGGLTRSQSTRTSRSPRGPFLGPLTDLRPFDIDSQSHAGLSPTSTACQAYNLRVHRGKEGGHVRQR